MPYGNFFDGTAGEGRQHGFSAMMSPSFPTPIYKEAAVTTATSPYRSRRLLVAPMMDWTEEG